ncbi:hypothetical protein V1290_001406 [Bradyrhizobium sp. AZCC 1578]|uniref:hypothetical protein n=1 Tax=Bradyrhizobium sp. AZCC 1578 TaxID=3117027 RepID=UPI002FEEE6EE
MVKQTAVKALLGFAGLGVLLWELPLARKFLATITTFDFFYERSKDPSWVGEVINKMINPPPGTALLVVLVGLVLIYWSTKPRDVKMSLPMIGMLVSAICFAGFGVWHLVKSQSTQAGTPQADVTPASDIDTHLSLKFGGGPPLANHLSNIWRWYALANVVVIVSPEGRKEIKTWNVFLTFEKPVNASQIVVSSQSALPEFEVKDRESRSAIIAFMGDLKNLDLEIKVLNATPAKPQKETAPEVLTTTTPAVVPPAPPPPPAPRPLSTYEAELKVRAIDKFLKVLSDDMQPVIDKFPLQQNWWNALKDPKDNPTFRPDLLAFRDEFKAACLKLDSLRNNTPEYKDLTGMVEQPQFTKTLKAIEKYLVQFMYVQDTVKQNASKEALLAFMDDSMTEYHEAMNLFVQWRNEARAKVLELRGKISP